MGITDCLNIVFMCDKLNMPEEAKKMKEVTMYLIEKSYKAMKDEKENAEKEVV